MKLFTSSIVISLLSVMICSCSSTRSLDTVEKVDIEKYAGKWYEIARLPQSFEKDCACVTAEYQLEEDQKISVLNTCYDTTKSEYRSSQGFARPVKQSENSKLKVQFFWPFSGDYYVIALDSNYQYAMIGAPSRKYLWILSRKPTLDGEVKSQLINTADSLGFDTEKLIQTPQTCEHV